MPLDVSPFIAKHRILVDTSTLMAPQGHAWVRATLWPALKAGGRQTVIPLRVYEELLEHIRKGDLVHRSPGIAAESARKKAEASAARDLVDAMRADGCADLYGSPADPFADAMVTGIVTLKRTELDFLVIMQDRNLAKAVWNIRSLEAIRSKKDLIVARVSKSGLHAWKEADFESSTVPNRTSDRTNTSISPHSVQDAGAPRRASSAPARRFPRTTGHVRSGAEPVPVSRIPAPGEEVSLAGGGTVRLGQQLARGGEGIIVEVENGRVAKIYHCDALKRVTLEKLEVMTRAPFALDGVCWPEAIVMNGRREPVGFIMPRAKGIPLDTSVFKKPLLLQKLPGWTRTNLVRVAIRVAEIVGELHAAGLILGDINPNNILVTPEGEVTFVDLDSAQIGDLPCPVGLNTFTRPQHHGRSFGSFLRDEEDDRFALAVMLFMILMPGKPPYSHAGGGEPGENVRKKHFPYRTNMTQAEGVPDGPWRFIWSHLSYKVKEAFENAFMHDRLPAPQEWVGLLRAYEAAIAAGHMDSEQGDHIFPTRSKRLTAEVQARRGIRQDEMVDRTCSRCGRTFEAKKETAARYPFPKCPDCRSAERIERVTATVGPRAAASGRNGNVGGGLLPHRPTFAQTSSSPRPSLAKAPSPPPGQPTASASPGQTTFFSTLFDWLRGR